ncbi:MAG: S-methyl-5-thioribose-1-phosphate isomerase [Anaerotardibacter sp.]
MSVESLPKTIVLNSEGTAATIVNQAKLPQKLEFVEITTWQKMVESIKTLEVRGAPAIGIAGGFALVLALRNQLDACAKSSLDACLSFMEQVAEQVVQARPTAVNLAWALEQVLDEARVFVARAGEEVSGPDVALSSAETPASTESATSMKASISALIDVVQAKAEAIRNEDEASCRKIGAYGAKLLPNQASVLTHCNAGSLATAFYGTALGVIYAGFEQGKIKRVYADETRPVGQGVRLTVWELSQAGVPVTLQCDNMAASLMAQGKIDAVIVGADRICANGDTANKIGTYGLAVLAKHHHIPLYVAAPFSTIDASKQEGSRIPIEFRSSDEICAHTPEGVEVYNPAFDVTPAELISAIITENGVFYPPYQF